MLLAPESTPSPLRLSKFWAYAMCAGRRVYFPEPCQVLAGMTRALQQEGSCAVRQCAQVEERLDRAASTVGALVESSTCLCRLSYVPQRHALQSLSGQMGRVSGTEPISTSRPGTLGSALSYIAHIHLQTKSILPAI